MKYLAILLITSCAFAGETDPSIVQQRISINSWYSTQLTLLKNQAVYYARQIPPADRALWTEYLKLYTNAPSPESTFVFLTGALIQTDPAFFANTNAIVLKNTMTENFFLDSMANFLLDENAFMLLSSMAENYNQVYSLRLQFYA
jgi:hypothetical protein